GGLQSGLGHNGLEVDEVNGPTKRRDGFPAATYSSHRFTRIELGEGDHGMTTLRRPVDELVTANRILAREGVGDAFGHVSIRHPDRPDRYWLSRARAPECIEASDVMEFTLEGVPLEPAGRKPYAERFIHGAVYEARPDVHAVVHSHSPSVIPFGITGTALR